MTFRDLLESNFISNPQELGDIKKGDRIIVRDAGLSWVSKTFKEFYPLRFNGGKTVVYMIVTQEPGESEQHWEEAKLPSSTKIYRIASKYLKIVLNK